MPRPFARFQEVLVLNGSAYGSYGGSWKNGTTNTKHMKLTNYSILPAACLAVALLAPVIARAVSFTDDFENSTLSPFWTANVTAGSVTFPSTAQAHGGTQSVTFAVAPSVQNYLFLHHVLPQLSYGTVSVWVYDPTPGESGNYFGLYLLSATNHLNIQTFDWDGSQYHYQLTDRSYDTGVARTRAWHHFVIESAKNEVRMSIDGVSVYHGPGGRPFDTVRIGLYGEDLASAPYFDDFQLTAVPATEPALSIRVSQVEVCWDSVTNNSYQVEYRSELTTNTWIGLGTPIAGDGTRLCVTDAVVSPRRFYRVVTLP